MGLRFLQTLGKGISRKCQPSMNVLGTVVQTVEKGAE